LDQSRWFNTVWSVSYWIVVTGGLAVGAIATHGLVRALLILGAALSGLVLAYTVFMVTVGVRHLDGILRSIDRTNRRRRGGPEPQSGKGA
jgi:hypothetical protein